MKELYKKARKSAAGFLIGGGLFFLLAGIGLVFYACPHLFGFFFAKAPDLFETPSSEYKEGRWFTCENNILFDYYSYDDKGRYYATATNDLEYFGFYVYNKEIDQAEEICNATYEYFLGYSEDFSGQYLTGKGYLTEMEPSERRFFEESFEYEGDTVDDYDVIYLTFRRVNLKQILFDEGDFFYALIGLVLFVSGICCICSFIFGGYKSGIKKSMKKYGILEEVLEKDMETATKLGNVYLGNEHVVFLQHPNTLVMPYNALVWSYVEVVRTQHRTYGIKTGTSTSYRIVMWDIKKKKNMVNVKSEDVGNKIIDEMLARAPYFYRGYNETLANMCDGGQFDEMVRAVEEKRLEVGK